jgi:hypothetical protein
METKHTKGPWSLTTGASGQVHVAFGHDGQYIAKVDACPVRSVDENEANARLITAAPDILAALDTIANPRRGRPEEYWDVTEIGNFARAAIARAMGQA